MILIGVKYCGGCMPGYDRTALVGQIRDRLKTRAQFVSWQNQDTELTMVVTGCPNACADIRAVSHKSLFFITQPQDAEAFITFIRSENLIHELEKLLPGKDHHSRSGCKDG